MMAKKLAEQQRELLKDMNQDDVDKMLSRHKSELLAMDTALKNEQDRQMADLRDKLKSRNEKAAKDKAMRQIKMAEIYKQKQ